MNATAVVLDFFGDLYISRAKFSSKSDNKLQGQKIGDWHLIELDY